jgi:hypothetical protein
MDSQDVLAIAGPVLALAQLTKWLIQRATRQLKWLGPVSIFFYAGVATMLWVYSNMWPIERTDAFTIFAAWVSVVLSAAGVYGFTRKMESGENGDRDEPPVPPPGDRLSVTGG